MVVNNRNQQDDAEEEVPDKNRDSTISAAFAASRSIAQEKNYKSNRNAPRGLFFRSLAMSNRPTGSLRVHVRSSASWLRYTVIFDRKNIFVLS